MSDEQNRQLEGERTPLVIEIGPGQAGDGVREVYEPDEYEGRDLRGLVTDMVEDKVGAQSEASIEGQSLAQQVQDNLEQGKMLLDGQEVPEDADLSKDLDEYAVEAETEDGEDFFYIDLQAVVPEEGGYLDL